MSSRTPLVVLSALLLVSAAFYACGTSFQVDGVGSPRIGFIDTFGNPYYAY